MLVRALGAFACLGFAAALLVSGSRVAFGQDQDPQGKTLVLVEPEPILLKAVSTALSPWDVHVVAVDRPTPGASMPGSAQQARAVAREQAADAVAWLSGAAGSRALWVYDSSDDKVVALGVDVSIPFDEASAAAVALTVKTLLRHSLAAPSGERYGATIAARATDADSSTSARPATAATVATATAATLGEAQPLLRVEVRGGPRIRQAGQLSAEPRLGLVVASAPLAGSPLSVGIIVAGGPGIAVEEPGLVGRYTDLAAGARLGVTPWAGTVSLHAALGASVHFTRLDGEIMPGGSHADVSRVDPSLDGELRVDTRVVGPIRLGAFLAADFLLNRQRYQVGDAVVLRLARLESELGVVVTIPIYW